MHLMHLITFHIKNTLEKKNIGTDVIMQHLKFNVKNNSIITSWCSVGS